jgi:hypothetical protein
MKSGRFCLSKSNSKAAASAFPVQLPSCPWSYTGPKSDVRSTMAGRAATVGRGAE